MLQATIFSNLAAKRRVFEISGAGKNPERKSSGPISISSKEAGFLHTDKFVDHCYF
jgi:hypothetical protein